MPPAQGMWWQSCSTNSCMDARVDTTLGLINDKINQKHCFQFGAQTFSGARLQIPQICRRYPEGTPDSVAKGTQYK